MFLFCFPEGWFEGPWDIPRSCRIYMCFSYQILLLVYFVPARTRWVSHVGRYRGYICMMFLPDLHAKIGFSWHHPLLLSSLPLKYHLYIISFSSFYSSSSHRQMTCQDGYEFYWRRAGHSAISFSPVDRLVPTFMRGNCLPLFSVKEKETMRVKYPIRFFLVKYACVEHSITQ